MSTKSTENRLRRQLQRDGYSLQRSRRDGSFRIVEASRNFVAFADWDHPEHFGLDLDDVAHWLGGTDDVEAAA
jgi:hypothetical protein